MDPLFKSRITILDKTKLQIFATQPTQEALNTFSLRYFWYSGLKNGFWTN